MIELIKKHALFVSILILVAAAYFLPTFGGKTHSMEDVRQSALTMLEAKEYDEKDGEAPGWTNQLFGGMPNDLIYQGTGIPNLIYYFTYNTPFSGNTSYPFQNLVLCFIGFYVFLICLKIDPLIALFGSLAYGFMSFTFSSIEAAHVNKVLAMAVIPPIVGGLFLIYKEKFITGFIIFTYHLSLQVFYFHYQVTYYTAIILAILGVYFFVKLLLDKKFKSAIFLVILSIAGSGLAAVNNAQRLVTTQEYSKNTMRGGSALSESNAQASDKGLEREYAFSWSYGVGETFTVLVPGLYGGSSSEMVTEKSPLYKKFQNPQVLEQGWPLYHGAMPSTSGPVYFGAIVIFLFILSFKLVKSEIKWPLYALTIIAIMLAWGKNFPSLNFYLFDNLPFYNKFRTPMMAMSIAQVTVLALAIMALAELFKQKISKEFIKKNILPALYGVGGFLIFIMVFGSTVFGTTSPNDVKYMGDNAQLIEAVQETRGRLMLTDSFRSLLFIGAAFAVIWFYASEKIKKQTAILLIGSLLVIDLVGVDMRYLTWKDFDKTVEAFEKPEPDAVDQEILRDADPHYRVMDMSRDPFNSNDAGAFHKLVGGYHAAKLSRYQDLISEYIVPETTREKAFDMLNCKYIIGANQQTNQRMSIKRETALGNAWFVGQLVTTMSDREEMDSLKVINPANQAVINISNQELSISEDISLEDENASISLISYHPDTLRYTYNSQFQRFVVFSEVHYDHWKLYVNGKETPLYKVNYTLRGALLPPGNADVEMIYEYKPAKVYYAETRYSSLAVVLMTLAWIGFGVFKSMKSEPKKA